MVVRRKIINTTRNIKSAKHRHNLPQLSEDFFLTDGGIETTLIFHNGFELPYFAAFDLLKHAEGRRALRNYYRTYAAIAKKYRVGFILESATWRASLDWGRKIGYSAQELAEINHQAINLLVEVRNEFEDQNSKVVISGCIGPRGDGYHPGAMMIVGEAEQYHRTQIETLAETEADMVTALTMTYAEEATGIVRAAQSVGMPVVISFTVETDGRLPSGMSLETAIEQVDTATNYGPAYYMINCGHPTHFEEVITGNDPWVHRIHGLRANASRLSHAQLDKAEELDDGDPVELGKQYFVLHKKMGNLNVLGGCCGTDHRHIEEICKMCVPQQVA